VADDRGLLAVAIQEAELHAARYFQALATILSDKATTTCPPALPN
jgi:hypothetical protein